MTESVHGRGPAEPMRQMRQMRRIVESWLIALRKAAPGAAYLAVYLWGTVKDVEGIWRQDADGASWIRINTDRERFGALRPMAADPLEYGAPYISPHGRGIVSGCIIAPRGGT